ncbi:hypothetical protein R3I94_004433 [Phoxinus phoxinus]
MEEDDAEEEDEQSKDIECSISKTETASACPVGPHDISRFRSEGPTQPNLQTFPKTFQGAAKRSFHSEWYKAYTWLEYSQSKDAAYCFACRHFSLPNAAIGVFTSLNGYSNWKKATFKDSGFSLHAKSDVYVNAMTAWLENKRMGENNSSLFALIDHDH